MVDWKNIKWTIEEITDNLSVHDKEAIVHGSLNDIDYSGIASISCGEIVDVREIEEY